MDEISKESRKKMIARLEERRNRRTDRRLDILNKWILPTTLELLSNEVVVKMKLIHKNDRFSISFAE